jgi:hypothetical protein
MLLIISVLPLFFGRTFRGKELWLKDLVNIGCQLLRIELPGRYNREMLSQGFLIKG